MEHTEGETAEQTYRSIGRFMFEFSQVEYTIRHYLAKEIELKDIFFSEVMESYDVGVLTTVAIGVFKKTRGDNGARIEKLLNRFRQMNEDRKRVAHGLWVPFNDGGTVHYVSRSKLSSSQFVDQATELEKQAEKLCHLRSELEQVFATTPDFHRDPDSRRIAGA
jgi:hypothetical protein